MANKFLTGRGLFFALMIITVLYTALLLATSQRLRDRSFQRLGALYQAAFRGPEKVTVTRVEVQAKRIVQVAPRAAPPPGPPKAPIIFKPGQATPIMRRPTEKEEAEETAATRASPPARAASTRAETPRPVVEAKSKEQETAYNYLLAGNQTMADWVNQRDSKLKFKTWTALKSEGDEHWIDVVFQSTADNSEIHYTWSVNNASRKILPVNHYAKQLAAK